MFGRSVGLPALRIRSRHRHFSAIPPSIAASLDPVVEQPVACSCAGEFHISARMLTHRASSSAVCGYSSLSIMFLSAVSAISLAAIDGMYVVTNVARFNRAWPSSSSSLEISSYAISLSRPLSPISWIGSVAAADSMRSTIRDTPCARALLG